MMRRLERAFSAQSEFVAEAARELRTPAMALGVHAELARNAETAEERASALAQVHHGAVRLNRLTQQLLAVASAEAGVEPAMPEQVDLLALCKSVILDQIQSAEAKQLDLGLAEHDAASVCGDADALRVLLRNLVDNAIRSTPAHGHVDVADKREPQAVVLEIRDDGPGIPPHERGRVLDRIYRGQSAGPAVQWHRPGYRQADYRPARCRAVARRRGRGEGGCARG